MVGTGNKVEDFEWVSIQNMVIWGRHFTNCRLTNWSLGIGKRTEISQEIIDAPPTDGLWDDGRTDEGQLGLSYKELEEAMENENSKIDKIYPNKKRKFA